MKKFIHISTKIVFILFITVIILFTGVVVYSLTVERTPLNLNKITDNELRIEIYNNQGLEIKENNTFNSTYIPQSSIPKDVKEAFISIEDKNFYNHKGINLSRISKAFVNNLTSFSLKEGASTITQQLIKNTHLSGDKTLPRKINEIKLALALEKYMTKDEILEHYLNVIYFGNNCYGIEDASKYYFNKSAKDLTLEEGALLAGIIKSPNYYSPIRHKESATARRNIVLSEMKKDNKISNIEYINAMQKPINININSLKKNKLNSYSQSAIDEAVKILKIPERQIALGDYKIYTYQDLNKQLKLQKVVDSFEFNNDYALLDIDTKTGGINSYIGSSDYKILDHKRQIGSIAKPILVYAPALNENILTPASLILDEPITIGNYTPKNVSGTYSGYVSVRDALSKSLNIPAVKTASYIGLSKINNYAKKMNLQLDEKDYSYSLALGGLTYGFTLKELCGAYSVFNNGEFTEPKFIKYITNKDGEIIYKNTENKNKVFRDDSAYLTTNILQTCAKTGTARKLAELPFEIASKTGTVGSKNGNTDAYNVSYTTEDIVGVWFGNMDNKLINIAGGNQPTALAKEYYKQIYANHKPTNFIRPNSIQEVNIDLSELENNHILVQSNTFTPEKYCKKEIFSKFNLPKNNNNQITLKPINLVGYVENGKAILKFNAINSMEYKIYKKTNKKISLLQTIKDEGGQIEINDTLFSNQKCEYYIEGSYLGDNSKQTFLSNSITLINTQTNNDITKNKWYI